MPDEQNNAPEVDSISFTLELLMPAYSTPEALQLQLLRSVEGGELPISSYNASWALLESEARAQAWLERTKELFRAEAGPAILNNLGLLLMVAGNRALIETGPALVDKKGILQTYVSLTEKLMRERLGLEAGRPSKWDADKLSKAIFDVMIESKDTSRTYDMVAQKLREKYTDRGPKNGESLRKTVKLLGVDWKKIKEMARKRS